MPTTVLALKHTESSKDLLMLEEENKVSCFYEGENLLALQSITKNVTNTLLKMKNIINCKKHHLNINSPDPITSSARAVHKPKTASMAQANIPMITHLLLARAGLTDHLATAQRFTRCEHCARTYAFISTYCRRICGCKYALAHCE